MGVLLIIAVEIIASAIMVSHNPFNNHNILGTRLAQVEIPPNSPPPDSSPPPPQESPTQSPINETASPEPVPPPVDSFNTNKIENYPELSTPPVESPQDQPSSVPLPSSSAEKTSEQETVPTQPTVDFSSTQQTAVLDSDQLLTTPDSVSEKNAQAVQKEDEQLAQNTSPEAQASQLLNFTKDKPAQIDQSIRSDDFGSVNFAAARMSDFVDRIGEIIKNLPPSQGSSIKRNTENLCKKTDFLLKSVQLMVPESSEQDLEITRGKCLSISL